MLSSFLPILLLLVAPPTAAAPGATYYVAPGGDDSGPGSLAAPWATLQKATAALGPGDTVLIRAGTYRERVVPQRSGTAGAEITFAAYPGENPVIDGTGVAMPAGLAGLFDITGQGYLRVRGLRIQNAGPGLEHAGILVDGAHHIVLEKNTTYDTVSSGIGVWGSQDVTIDGNEVVRACHGGQQEQLTVASTSGFEVVRNLVHDAGADPIGGEGIDVKDGSHGGRVWANQVWNLPSRVGLYVDAWDKHTYDVELDGNLVHDCAEGIILASEMGGLLENIRVTNNVVRGNGVRGLTVADYGGVATHPMSNLVVANNTFDSNGTSGWGGGISVDSREATGVLLRNNIVSGNQSFQIVLSPGVPSATVDRNLVFGFHGYEGETLGTNPVEGDPLFVDAAAHDYHLRADSPALDRGSALGAPPRDFDGVTRPQGSGIDLGAYERPVAGNACVPSATALCIDDVAGDRRFQVGVTFATSQGGGVSGNGNAISTASLGISRGGLFWFFAPDNPEMLVKVLNGCATNGRYWFFSSAGTNVGLTTRVTDTRTGAAVIYTNPDRTPALPVQDTAAFPCGS